MDKLDQVNKGDYEKVFDKSEVVDLKEEEVLTGMVVGLRSNKLQSIQFIFARVP